jgi:hypothetical protein
MQLECECGYVADEDSSDALIGAAQRHAWDAHQIRLASSTILSIAGRRGAPRPGVSQAQAQSAS